MKIWLITIITTLYIVDDDLDFISPRDYDEQTDAFRFELDALVDRFLEEFDVNTITLVGALTEKTKELLDNGSIEFEVDDDFFDDDEDEDDYLWDLGNYAIVVANS